MPLSNLLLWATNAENMEHAKVNGLRPKQKGESHGKSKLTEKQVLEIRASNLSDTKLSEMYGIGRGAIYHIRKGNRWQHLNT